jgi:hypothetical protein
LSAPLLDLNKSLHPSAIKAFRAIQRIMGDRDRDMEELTADATAEGGVVLGVPWSPAILEEARKLLDMGITYGELRDEIYVGLIKQLSDNPFQ